MDKFTKIAVDAFEQYDEAGRRTRWPPLKSPPPASVWSPVMTEQQRKEHEQYVKEHNLPF
jgi:hypothetical protein